MNFFEHQNAAKKNTWLLVGLLMLAVASLVLITIFIFSAAFHYSDLTSIQSNAAGISKVGFIEHFWQVLHTPLAFYTAITIIMVILGASFVEFRQLQQGGSYIAQSLGGKLIANDTQDFNQRMLLNIVEEMAIASGNSVPNVYLLPEKGINAFAAGNDRRDSVIGITQGALEQLNRDELQGVIAHEFSHIHNGDTKINMRLIALIFGILIIAVFGRTLLNSARYSAFRSRKRESALPLVLLGLALLAVGYLGMFFGNLIKAAVSRQREFLADASAVQFTRNPDGIGGALKKIGGLHSQSYLTHPSAFQFTHMFFSAGVKQSFSDMFATHPPLKERILRVEPNWNRQFIYASQQANETTTTTTQSTHTSNFAASTNNPFNSALDSNKLNSIEQLTSFSSSEQSMIAAKMLIAKLPKALYEACHEPSTARAAVYLMLLSDDSKIKTKQFSFLKARAHPLTFKHIKILERSNQAVTENHKLNLIEIAIAALKTQSVQQKKLFLNNIHQLLKLRPRPLYEWCLVQILQQALASKPIIENRSLKSQSRYAMYLLRFTIAFIRSENSPELTLQEPTNSSLTDGKTAFEKAWKLTGLPFDSRLIESNLRFSFHKTSLTLNALSRLKPLEKPKLIKAVATILTDDGRVTEKEKAFFRAVCDTLNCPVSPLNI